MKIRIIVLVVIMVVVGFAYYVVQSNQDVNQVEVDRDESMLQVVTTTTQITDLLNILAGDVLKVEGLMGAGIDPHSYQATEADVRKLQNADLIFYNGLHLEGKMDDLFSEMSTRGIATYAITDAIDESKFMEGEDEYEGSHDPHIWFDVKLWIEVTNYVRDILVDQDPTNKDIYINNAANLVKELEKIYEYVINKALTIPEAQRVLITAHDAFQYFGEAYGFEVLGIEGISTESEAGIADIRELADFIAKNKIKAIFVESSVTTRNVMALQEAVKSRGFNVDIGGEIYSDAMGDPGTYEGTYIGMMKYNIETIANALR